MPEPVSPTSVASGADLIAAERQRQIDAEGWTPEHDAEHDTEALALAAACYVLPAGRRGVKRVPVEPRASERFMNIMGDVPALWPWGVHFWKPKPDDRVRELVKAGALIAAEIDRLNAHQKASGAAHKELPADGPQPCEKAGSLGGER